MKLHCTNCGSDFEELDSPNVTKGPLGTEYVCPVCEFYPVWGKHPREVSPFSVADLEKSIRQTLIQARASGLPVNEIVGVLKSELEFAAEMNETGHSFLVQLIDLGSPENTINPAPLPESRNSPQNEGTNW